MNPEASPGTSCRVCGRAAGSVSADLGAGDLLRALALAGDDSGQAHRYAALLGYAHAPLPPQKPKIPEIQDVFSTAPARLSDEDAILSTRFQSRLFGLLEEPEAEELPPPLDVPHAGAGLGDADCQPRRPLVPIQLLPLVAPGRLWPALKQLIQTTGDGALDLPALIRLLAHARQPRILPRRRVARGVERVVVVLDRARHLMPLAPDMELAAAELRHLTGQSGFVGYSVAGHPEQVREHWGAGPAAAGGKLPVPRAATVILVSDLGLARREPGGACLSAWFEWMAALERAGSQVRVVSPVSGVTLNLPSVLTLAEGRLHRPSQRVGRTHLAQALERLKCALACAVQVEPELLRAMRLADPALAPYPELESLYRQDDEVVPSRFGILRPDAAARHRLTFGGWPVAAQRRVLRVLRSLHGGDYRAVEMTETLLWATHAAAPAREREAAAINEAHDWYAHFERERLQAPASPAVRSFANAVWGVVSHDQRAQARYSRWLAPLWALDEARRRSPPPPGLDLDALRDVVGFEPVAAPCRLVQQGDWLIAQPGPATPGQSPIAGPLAARTLRVRRGGDGREQAYSGQRAPLARLSDGDLEVRLDRRRLRIGELQAPWWALETGRDQGGAYVLMPVFSGSPRRVALPLTASGMGIVAESTSKGRENGWSQQVDETGPYIDLRFGKITQRLRWIPPGEFLMGSPQDEPQSYDNEHPRHRVILTQGYWLADTACTQALWQAAMGENPSDFQDAPENPVENVSWDDVQGFLEHLGKLTGIKAELPSEAQWEYACRAGTATPFWWGERLTVRDANYDGSLPYNDGEKGEWRQRTLPVKMFRPNPWGLWQVHGNVYEWCRDGLRTYAETVAVDPEGPPEGGRALRGGSWIFFGRSLRAAYRIDGPPGLRYRYFGFRFLLRSPAPVARRAGL